MAQEGQFQIVFRQLKDILKKFEPDLLVQHDLPDTYDLNTPYTEKYHKELFFGSVQIKKRYVSYYLMPVYIFPDLLGGISPQLRARMQGKSCFNFTSVKPELFAELARLSQSAMDRMKAEKLVP